MRRYVFELQTPAACDDAAVAAAEAEMRGVGLTVAI
jgi:hypothetical protein